MRTIGIDLFKFEELSDRAKEKAREWWRELEGQDFGSDDIIYEPFETAAEILGIEFAQYPVKLMGGGTRYKPKIWWSGFWSQGDGASFEGTYRYAKGCSKKIRKEFGPGEYSKPLYEIADRLTALQKKHFYRIYAKITQSGHYNHEYTMHMDCCENCETGEYMSQEVEDEVLEITRDFARWIYKTLEQEYDYRMSDECVDESIIANEYEFDGDGNHSYRYRRAA